MTHRHEAEDRLEREARNRRLEAEDEMDAEEPIDRLEREKAELLEALQQCIPWLKSMPLPADDQPLRDMAAKTLNDAEVAIAKYGETAA
jgi:hypothetical protein